MPDQPLGRRTPGDFVHVARYRRTAPTMPYKPTPVIAGTLWYSAFDEPVWDDRGWFWMVGRDTGNLGRIRGGHAYCFKPSSVRDLSGWFHFYDQGQEGAC